MSYIEDALESVEETLTTRGQAWTPKDASEFHNFELHESIRIDPFQFALAMLNLKLNRAKNRWAREGIRDDDLEDSIKDLACYAVLAMGILKKMKEPKCSPQTALDHQQDINIPDKQQYMLKGFKYESPYQTPQS